MDVGVWLSLHITVDDARVRVRARQRRSPALSPAAPSSPDNECPFPSVPPSLPPSLPSPSFALAGGGHQSCMHICVAAYYTII